MRRIAMLWACLGAALVISVVIAATASAASSTFSWGANFDGELGDGTTIASDVPVPVNELDEATAIAAGGSQGLALVGNGEVLAWGNNEFGQLGDGTTTDSDVPVRVTGLVGVKAIAAGEWFSLALLTNGTVMAWGENEVGELGNGTTSGPEVCRSETNDDVAGCSTRPVPVKGLGRVTAISAGGGFALALLSDGQVMAWGENEAGTLGDGTDTGPDRCVLSRPCSTTPIPVKLPRVRAIAAGASHSLALLTTGKVMAWGENEYGELGNGTTGPESCEDPAIGTIVACNTTPVAVQRLDGATAISAGQHFSMALRKNGRVKTWGQNASFGNGSDVPVTVWGLREVRAISAGYRHGLALTAKGSVEAWGANELGELGNGTTQYSDKPVQVKELSGATAISAGFDFSFALVTP